MFEIKFSYDHVLTEEKFNNIPENESGIYVIFDEQETPLYVGITSCLRKRLKGHFSGNSHTMRYSKYFQKVGVIFESNYTNKLAAEYYLINYLKTPLNGTKNRVGLPPKVTPEKQRCAGYTLSETRCKHPAHRNGYCHVHGGDGVTRTSIMNAALENYDMK